jgi:hypothetical protein
MAGAHAGNIPMFLVRIRFSLIFNPITNLPLKLLSTKNEGDENTVQSIHWFTVYFEQFESIVYGIYAHFSPDNFNLIFTESISR